MDYRRSKSENKDKNVNSRYIVISHTKYLFTKVEKNT